MLCFMPLDPPWIAAPLYGSLRPFLVYLNTEINDSEFVFHQVVSIVVAQSNQIEVAKTSGFEFDRLTLEMI